MIRFEDSIIEIKISEIWIRIIQRIQKATFPIKVLPI